MLGSYRLFLASSVALVHISFENSLFQTSAFDFSAAAVYSFYFISGCMMSQLYARHLHAEQSIGRFFLDRFIRLYPAFAITALGYIAIDSLISRSLPNFWNWIPHLIILGDTYWFSSQRAVPPIWSLGIELHFYALVPFIAKMNMKTVGLIASALYVVLLFVLFASYPFSSVANKLGLSTYCTSPQLCGVPINVLLGYEFFLLPGAVFLFGYLFGHTTEKHKLFFKFYFLTTIGATLYGASVNFFNNIEFDLTFGAALFISLGVLVLERKQVPANSVDRYLSRLAYPLFLAHYPAIRIVARLELSPKFWSAVLLTIVFTIAIAAFQHYVDQARYKLRNY